MRYNDYFRIIFVSQELIANFYYLCKMTEEKDISKLPVGYIQWRRKIVTLIENAKLNAAIHVNTDMLSLYWSIGNDIIRKKNELGWGAQVIEQLSMDLTRKFPEDKGYSVRNLHYMRRFAENYPDFPILQVPLAEFKDLPISQEVFVELARDKKYLHIPLSTVSWYHHISMLPKIKNNAERAFYILETTRKGWSRDVMMSKINGGYMKAVGKAITNFTQTLPEYQSDLAQYAFKDPYNFSFIGTMALQHERDIEKRLAERITEFLLELGHGFAYVGRQYNVVVDGDDYYIDILMYHLKLHCYVVVELLCCTQHKRSNVA